MAAMAGCPPLLTFLLLIVAAIVTEGGVHFDGSESSYARYPKWNACMNATLSFEFKTTEAEGLLLYTDDGGRYDFIELTHTSGRVQLVLNIVDGREGRLQIDVGRNVNDGRWHRVEIRRNRMETTLMVDGVSASRVAFGSDFEFGRLDTNSEVFFGGLPDEYGQDLHTLALPSTFFQPRFVGAIRNVLYGNCSCLTTRAEYVSGVKVGFEPREQCDVRNPCSQGCICISEDEAPACDCAELECIDGKKHDGATHYSLPMDLISGTTVINPSGLDAKAVGKPATVPGVRGNAIQLNGPDQYIRVSGPGHRSECFGDLDKCPEGYTLALWVKFQHPVDSEEVILSNGGHSENSYGVAMLYGRGTLQFRFRRKNAQEWRVSSDNILPGRWYHVAATWAQKKGLSLYVDGVLTDSDQKPQVRGSVPTKEYFSDFVLGRSDDKPEVHRRTRRDTKTGMAMDEFHFSSTHKTTQQIGNMGPIFNYYFPMEVVRGNQLPDSKTQANLHGNPSIIRGKVGHALRLDGRMEYVDGGDVGDRCLGDLQLCTYGLSASFWINSFHVKENMYYIDSGSRGLRIYYKGSKLVAEFQQGNKNWKVGWPDFERNQWYFIEVSWNPEDGARMYVNLNQVGHTLNYKMMQPVGGTSTLYIGRANTLMVDEAYAQAYIDELEIYHADRARLLLMGRITRDEVRHIHVPYERAHDNVIVDDNFRILVYNGAHLEAAKVGKGVNMDGSLQYTTMGELRNDCFGNLEKCDHGLTMRFQVYPRQLRNNMYIMSSGPYQLYYRNGRLYATFSTAGKTWTCSTSNFNANQWQELELTWHAQRGLQMYVNGRKVQSDTTPQTHAARTITDWNVYLGRPNKMIEGGENADILFDEMDIWYAHKDFIGLWPKNVRRDIIDMDRLIGNLVEHDRHTGHNVYAMNNPSVVRGWIDGALSLDGINQYISGGPNCSCQGNLQRCYNGFTLRARVRPQGLVDGMYLFSSAAYDIYYKRGRIWADFRTPTHSWNVHSSAFDMNNWNLFEWTWHPSKGLQMLVNGRQVASDSVSRANTDGYDTKRMFYVGRANSDMTGTDRYGKFIVDDVQLWEAYREILIDNGFIDPNDKIRPKDIRKDIIDMDRIVGNQIVHDNHLGHHVYAYNRPTSVRGWIDGAVKLDGINQYINVGANATCGGNLENCAHGFTLRNRIKGSNLREGMYLYSSPMFDIYYSRGKIWCAMHTPTQTWTVSSAAFNKRDWNLFEYTWHRNKGLKMYVNKREVAQDRNPVARTGRYMYTNPMYIGRAATDAAPYKRGQFTVDDVQLWEAWRQYLIDDNLIKPDEDPDPPPSDIDKDIIDMDSIQGNTVVHTRHPGHYVYAVNRPTNVAGWIGNGVQINGVNQYMNAGANTTCRGNLANCKLGFTMRSRVKLEDLRDGMYLYSCAAYDIYYRGGKIWAEFRTPDNTWRVSSNQFKANDWNIFDFSWHPTKGLIMYANNREVARSNVKIPNTTPYDYKKVLYIGRANTDMAYERYGQFTVDDVQLWKAERQYLIDEGLIDPTKDPSPPAVDVRKDIIDMDFIRGNRVVHSSHPGHNVYVINRATNVPGWKRGAVRLNGQNQYLDLGSNATCNGNLENCRNGFTFRSAVKPGRLIENSYWYSSGPFDVYYKNGKINADFRTPNQKWTVSTGTYRRNDWNLIEYSWHPTRGLVMYVNGRRVATDSRPAVNGDRYVINRKFYIGRTDTDMLNERYGQISVDDVQLWQASRDVLIKDHLIDPTDIPSPDVRSTPAPTTTTSTTPEPENYIIFDGKNWILYDLYRGLTEDQRQKNNYEQFMIEFKASNPNGLLWWAGTEDRNVHLSLKNGQMVFVADYGGDVVDRFTMSPPSRRSLVDGEWHTAIITRRGKNLVMSLDGLVMDQVLQQEPSIVGRGAVLIGGYQDAKDITNNYVRRNLDGYVKQMQIRGDHIPQTLDLFDLFNERPRQSWVVPNGLLPETARSRPEAVSFTKKGAHIRLPQWSAQHEGVISFKFRTTEPDGLVLYNEPASNARDFVSVEMYDGVMYFIIDTGAGVHRFPFSNNIVNNGLPHEAKIERSRRQLVLTMDGQAQKHRIPGSNNEPLDLGNRFYVGAVDNAARLPWHLWTRQEKYFLGCLWDLEFNNARPVDLAARVRDTPMDGLQIGCVEKVGMCVHNPCAHGRCVDTWTGTYCDCAGTVYTGNRCQYFANVVTFDGTDFLKYDISPMMVTHTNDISVRFKTKKNDGLLFLTANKVGNDYIRALIEGGHGKLRTNLGGREQVIEFGRDLADNEWHTLYIKRRADDLWVWVDDENKVKAELPGQDYTLNVDQVYVAAQGEDVDPAHSFAGWMQNFFFDRHDVFKPPPGWIKGGTDPPTGLTGKPIPEFPVTLSHPMDSYATLDTLEIGEDTEISFMFKTKESDGLLLYNAGADNEFLAVELVDGYVLLVLDDGTGAQIYKATSEKLNDERWHSVKIRRVGFAFTIVVDETSASFSGRNKRQGDQLDLSGALYIGGMPRHLYNRLPVAVQSRHGFRGCLASIRVGTRLVNLMKDALSITPYIKENCTATGKFCFPGACHNHGICLDGWDTFICDCNMTAYVGHICTDEPEGYRFGEKYRPGVYVYSYDKEWDSRKDSLALGFMTWYENGTIARIESKQSSDYIEAKMKDGFVVIEYNIGGGKRYIVENRAKFNDGQYHVLVFERSGENATLRVDDFPTRRLNPAGSTLRMFNLLSTIKVGGNVARDGRFYNVFGGIVAGLYFNGLRAIDSGIIYGSIYGVTEGDVTVAPHPFYLPKPKKTIPIDPDATEKPGTGGTPIPPGPLPNEVPPGQGGGVVWKESFNGEGLAVLVEPGGMGAGAGNVGAYATGGQIGGGGGGAGGVGGAAEGARAAAIAGAFLGALLLGSSLIWALYKFKPGLIPFGGGGGGGAGGGGLKISSPTGGAYTRVATGGGAGGGAAGTGVKVVVDANGAAAGAAGAAGGAGGIMVASSGTQTLDRSGMMAGGGGGGGGGGAGGLQTQTFNEYFSSMSASSAATAVGAGGAAMAGGAGGPGSYGTMTRAIQTDQAADTAAQTTAGYGGMSDQQQFQQFQETANSYSALDSYQASSYMQNTLQADHSGAWQMQHMALTGAPNLATLAAEEIRVDCLLMTSDGRNVVTGSIFGPPQAWDLASGELVRIMSGEELSSTDLHLACNDTLLVGQVAEMTQIDPSDPQATSRIHHRKLQIWDFLTGRPLEMDKNELCTASCMMADGERIVLGRTEKFGGGTTVVIYDLLANEPVRKLRYDAAVGFADYISYLNLSKDNRYVIAGFQNSFDGNANFIIFDLTADSYSNAVEPKLLALDACAECTAVLDNHEAVTGTRSGELLIWSMRTGKPLRQLVSPAGSTTMTRMGISKSIAHGGEVKAVSVSRDGRLLVSASADCSVKVWNLESERLLTTLKGHNDEVWCCTISVDNDIVVSGSKDGTIRLWRLATASPICVYQTGVDVFSVRMSNNKRTIVALGDKYGARKLIMLRVVVTKTRSRAPSRATSPLGFQTGSRPTSPLRATTPTIR